MLPAWREKTTVSITSEVNKNKIPMPTASGVSHPCGNETSQGRKGGDKIAFKRDEDSCFVNKMHWEQRGGPHTELWSVFPGDSCVPRPPAVSRNKVRLPGFWQFPKKLGEKGQGLE